MVKVRFHVAVKVATSVVVTLYDSVNQMLRYLIFTTTKVMAFSVMTVKVTIYCHMKTAFNCYHCDQSRFYKLVQLLGILLMILVEGQEAPFYRYSLKNIV